MDIHDTAPEDFLPSPGQPHRTAAGEHNDEYYAEKLAAISRFSSVVSHELRNPLASLKNIAYFLSKAIVSPDEKIKRMLDILSSEIDRANGIITTLSEISHIRRENRTLSSLKELIEKAMAEVPLAKTVTISAALDQVEAKVDPDKFKLVVKHLLTNARDAVGESGAITVGLSAADNRALLTVSDTGCGMDPETLARAFEPMFSTKTKVLGMGLTIVKEVVAMHGGSVEAASEQGKGSTFRVSLPL